MTLTGHFIDDVQRRDNAVALALYAVNAPVGRHMGDPVHEEVTEGRYAQWRRARDAGQEWAKRMVYSSCGDLAAWMLYRLGCRDERLVNRTADEGVKDWIPGRNVSAITSHAAYRRATGTDAAPQPGDVMFLMLPPDGHISILCEWDEANAIAITADYGQPEGARRIRKIRKQGGRWTLDGAQIGGWLDLDRVAFDGPLNLDGVP